jgi:hypothetical protein
MVMATVVDKEHEHVVHHESHTDKKGHTTHSSHTHDYYWVRYARTDGRTDRDDVGYWKYGNFTAGQKIVVHLVIGGVTGNEYHKGITVFTGGEAN